MKISCTQEKLNKGLATVSRIVSSRATLPVLSNILIEGSTGELKLSATDLEIGITTSIGAKVDEGGAITVPARLISEFVANNNDENIELSTSDLTLHLKSQRYEANIKGIDSSEFPQVPAVGKAALIELDSADFIRSVSEVIIAAATDETRPVLAGLYFKFDQGNLYLVSTDSYRLAEKKISIKNKDISKEFIVPVRTMHEVARIAANQDKSEKIAISATDNQVSFTIGPTLIVSRLIEGAFPNYRQIIPTTYNSRAVMDLKEFSSAVKMAALFARQGANNVKIKFSDSKLVITSVAEQLGDNISTVSAEIEGEEIEIVFNVRYITEILAVLNDKKIILEVTDKTSPAVIKTDKSSDYIYIIMPLRVED